MPGLVIRYDSDIAAHDDQPSRWKGETYVVADEAAAKKVHPFATIVGYENELPFADGGASASASTGDAPKWYQKLKAKAIEDGQSLAAYRDGETQKDFLARVAAGDVDDPDDGEAEDDSNTGDEDPSDDAGDDAGDSGNAS